MLTLVERAPFFSRLLTGILVDRLVQWHKPGVTRQVNCGVFTLVPVGSVVFYGLALHAAVQGSA
jgi:hypothetical protein